MPGWGLRAKSCRQRTTTPRRSPTCSATTQTSCSPCTAPTPPSCGPRRPRNGSPGHCRATPAAAGWVAASRFACDLPTRHPARPGVQPRAVKPAPSRPSPCPLSGIRCPPRAAGRQIIKTTYIHGVGSRAGPTRRPGQPAHTSIGHHPINGEVNIARATRSHQRRDQRLSYNPNDRAGDPSATWAIKARHHYRGARETEERVASTIQQWFNRPALACAPWAEPETPGQDHVQHVATSASTCSALVGLGSPHSSCSRLRRHRAIVVG